MVAVASVFCFSMSGSDLCCARMCRTYSTYIYTYISCIISCIIHVLYQDVEPVTSELWQDIKLLQKRQKEIDAGQLK